jgi:HD-GYP domain-containing protein (c-di-GMP phosphodiesterase class II)
MENETFGVLDPRVTGAFLNNIAAYYLGDFVRLTTGELGEIVYINPRHISQPLVKIGTEFVDLSGNTSVKIVELI